MNIINFQELQEVDHNTCYLFNHRHSIGHLHAFKQHMRSSNGQMLLAYDLKVE